MQIKWDNREYDFDIDDMTVTQAKVIKVHTGFTLMGLVAGLKVGDPDALRAVFWLMHAQSGVTCDIDRVDFRIVDFLNAMTEAQKTEAPEIEEETPKDESTE